MTTINETVERILSGALRALTRRGPRKLSVSDICDEAGVARATFYRYFTNRDDVLEALGLHYEQGVSEALARAITARPEPERRLQVVLEAIVEYRERNRDITQLMDSEPAFALRFLRDVFPNLVNIFVTAVDPALEAIPAVRAGQLTKAQVGDLLFRIVVSQLLLPSADADKLPQLVTALWETIPGVHAAAS